MAVGRHRRLGVGSQVLRMADDETLRLVWAGPLQAEESLLHGSAPHPATMRWQHTYVGGLRECGAFINWIGHDPHRVWPWGPAALTADVSAFGPDDTPLPYLNLPFVRRRSLITSYRQAIVRAIVEHRAHALVSYNAEPWMAGAAAEGGVPWIPIILDFEDPRPDDWASFRAATAGATATAFVSHWAFENAPIERKHLLLPAVVARETVAAPPRESRNRVILYAGSRSRAGGVDRLMAAVDLLKTPAVEFVLTGQGKGRDPSLAGITARSSRIRDLGMVAENELQRLALAADVLVNPRPVLAEHSCMNFPSKVLDYISYGRPIVSTRAAGLGPAFDDVLVYTEGDDPSHLARAIDEVLQWSQAEVAACAERCRRFTQQSSPATAAGRFVEWIGAIVLKGAS